MEDTKPNQEVRLILIERSLQGIEADIAHNTQLTKDLLEAWKSTKNVVAFILIVSKIVAAVTVIYVGFRALMHWPWTP